MLTHSNLGIQDGPIVKKIVDIEVYQPTIKPAFHVKPPELFSFTNSTGLNALISSALIKQFLTIHFF